MSQSRSELERRVRERVAAAEARGVRVIGYVPDREHPRDVILSDDPPGSTYGICPLPLSRESSTE